MLKITKSERRDAPACTAKRKFGKAEETVQKGLERTSWRGSRKENGAGEREKKRVAKNRWRKKPREAAGVIAKAA